MCMVWIVVGVVGLVGVVEFFQYGFVVYLVFVYFYLQFEEYFVFEQVFYVLVGGIVDCFELGVVLVDYDGFLVIVFYLDYGVDFCYVIGVVCELFDFYCGGVWQFLVQLQYELFVYYFGSEEVFVVIGYFVFVVDWWLYWQMGQDCFFQFGQVFFFQCVDVVDFVEGVGFGQFGYEWEQCVFVFVEVDFVDCQQVWGVLFVQCGVDGFVFVGLVVGFDYLYGYVDIVDC